jgi:predicted regulator of Ras-like GTPase activity (Roadblock/LC7/MglB family)
MSVDLDELNNIDGVENSFIYTKGGTLLVPQLPYNDAQIEHFGREVALCSALLEKIRPEVDFFELIYEERHIIVRISHNFFILVVCEDDADTTLIKLTLNVIHEEVKGDTDIQKSLRKAQGKRDLLAAAQEESELRELLEKINITA